MRNPVTGAPKKRSRLPCGFEGVGITRNFSSSPMQPVRMGYRPVCSAAREGVQMGAALIHCVNWIPDRISRSVCGVETFCRPEPCIGQQITSGCKTQSAHRSAWPLRSSYRTARVGVII